MMMKITVDDNLEKIHVACNFNCFKKWTSQGHTQSLTLNAVVSVVSRKRCKLGVVVTTEYRPIRDEVICGLSSSGISDDVQ